jgi:tRNA threonylcarbamoyladenosine biosynthesis protein TsaB
MRTLAVDTSTQAGSLAVVETVALPGGTAAAGQTTRVLGVVATCTDETYSSRMFRQLDFLLRETGLALGSFDVYSVAAGPGSFTGLRVGLAAVKGWAEVHRKPIAAISGLEAVAAQARVAEPLLVPVVDARRGQIYAGVYRRTERGLSRIGDEVVMTLAEFLAELPSRVEDRAFAFVTTSPEVVAEPLAQSPFRQRPLEVVSNVLAPVLGQLGLERASRDELVDALALDANYIRRSDAELLWKG